MAMIRSIQHRSIGALLSLALAGSASAAPDETRSTTFRASGPTGPVADGGRGMGSSHAVGSATANSELASVALKDVPPFKTVDNSDEVTIWGIDSDGGGLSLQGRRRTYYGYNQFSLICRPGDGMFLHAVFNGEDMLAAQNSEAIIATMPAHGIVLDDQMLRLDRPPSPRVSLHEGMIDLFAHLDTAQLTAIAQADKVGVSFQFVYGGETFYGFDDMEFSEGRRQLPELMALCRGALGRPG